MSFQPPHGPGTDPSRQKWCSDKAAGLQQDDLRLSTLSEMNEELRAMSHDELRSTANLLDLPTVFDCLNHSSMDQVSIACDVLTTLLSNLSLGESTTRYGALLERALHHPYPSVKTMALEEISRTLAVDAAGVLRVPGLLAAAIRCMGDEDLGVAQLAAGVLRRAGERGCRALLVGDSAEALREVMAGGEVVRLRVYEVIVQLCKELETNLTLLSTPLLEQMLEELNTRGSKDILFKMNILELLCVLAESKHGYSYLEQRQVIDKQLQVLNAPDPDDATLRLLEPGLLRFYGRVARWQPVRMLDSYGYVVRRLMDNLETNDFTLLGVTYDTIAQIGLTSEGKQALNAVNGDLRTQHGNVPRAILRTFCRSIASQPTEVKVRGLSCVETLLRGPPTSITREWYGVLGDDTQQGGSPMGFIMKYARNPFHELRLAGFGVLHAVAEQPWGIEQIKDTPGLLEFLLDRSAENKKECKEAKFEICRVLWEGAITKGVFDTYTRQRLEQHIKEGPFYVNAITEVAVEGND